MKSSPFLARAAWARSGERTIPALRRDDALKVLPDAFAADADRLARFRREAQVLASLNHPNIAHVYGLEQADGLQALVMELVEGPTLADRIAQGPIPIDEALPIATQIAEALEAADERGIIHRDLKPANVKVRPDGTVKVLDFGLAKALEPMSAASVDATASPTITSPALMTGVGVLLGTAAYMSPEQARGKPVDKRSDIWAFGCVLYEMLTGKRAFEGEEVSDVLASVLAREPDWTILPDGLSPVLGTFLKRCLHKDRRHRIGDAQSIRLALEGAFDEPGRRGSSHIHETSSHRRTTMRGVVTASAAAVALGGLLSGTAVWWLTRPAESRVVRTEVTTAGATALNLAGPARDLTMTPDGSRIVYRGLGQLLVRAVDQLEPMPIKGVGNPYDLFASPDGQWIGFFDGTLLKKVAVTGGPPVTILNAEAVGRGATWVDNDTILFATAASEIGLQRGAGSGVRRRQCRWCAAIGGHTPRSDGYSRPGRSEGQQTLRLPATARWCTCRPLSRHRRETRWCGLIVRVAKSRSRRPNGPTCTRGYRRTAGGLPSHRRPAAGHLVLGAHPKHAHPLYVRTGPRLMSSMDSGWPQTDFGFGARRRTEPLLAVGRWEQNR
jgi:serine/threonine-protein kinase